MLVKLNVKKLSVIYFRKQFNGVAYNGCFIASLGV